MLTPVLAGQIHVVNCEENFVKAIYDQPRFYSTVPQKHTRCAEGRTCGDVVATANGPEYFQLTVEENSFPMTEELCGMGGCGAHPEADAMTSKDKLMEAQFEQFQMMIDVRFMKYMYAPTTDNLAVATVTAVDTITIDTPTGAVDVVDYVAVRENFQTAITTALSDINLAMGYDDAIQPTTITAADLAAECICCLDGEGLRRLVGFIQGQVNNAFKSAPSSTGMILVANPADIPYTTLTEMRMNLHLGTVNAEPFARAGLTPDSQVSGHDAFDIAGNTLILSYMAPAGTILVLPEQVREYVQFAQSPFETQVNAASSCDWESWHLAKKGFGWMIPSCYRDKYFLVDMTGLEDCCHAASSCEPL